MTLLPGFIVIFSTGFCVADPFAAGVPGRTQPQPSGAVTHYSSLVRERGGDMKDKIFIDLGQIMDDIFEATQNFGGAFKDGFRARPGNPFSWDENTDYYPAHSYPPSNIYITPEKNLVFEFALAGFDEKDISLEFKGDYMVLNAKAPESRVIDEEGVRFLKRRLKFKEIVEQKYFAPADKFDRDAVQAVFAGGILTVTVPAKAEQSPQSGVKIRIVKEEA